MEIDSSVLKNEERIAFLLRSLYRKYGFMQYKMSKFEEYDLYAQNRDFLVSDSIITFTDLGGHLMALKPDVTLSIVRSTRDEKGCVNKVYYDERVYRAPRSSHSFKEIMQVGLECIGDICDYNIFETVFLAVKSLETITGDYVLNISHLGIINSQLDKLNLPAEERKEALNLIAGKNMHEFEKLCISAYEKKDAAGAAGGREAYLEALNSCMRVFRLSGKPEDVITSLIKEGVCGTYVGKLKALTGFLDAAGVLDHVCIDFSDLSSMHYYNGIVFRGYVDKVPGSVLSGGQYDKLVKKLGRSGGAVGFAVYMDFLERYCMEEPASYADAVIIYDENTSPEAIFEAVKSLTDENKSCTAQREVPKRLRYKKLYTLNAGSGLKEVRNA